MGDLVVRLYTKGGSGIEEQELLRDPLARSIAAVSSVASNSSAPQVFELDKTGFVVTPVQATRVVNSKASGRGSATEVPSSDGGTSGSSRQRRRPLKEVVAVGLELGLVAREQYRCGRRIWGAVRTIDVVLTDPKSRRRLGIECKFRASRAAPKRNPSHYSGHRGVADFRTRRVQRAGFSANIKIVLYRVGACGGFDDLDPWLRLFFSLDLPDEERGLDAVKACVKPASLQHLCVTDNVR